MSEHFPGALKYDGGHVWISDGKKWRHCFQFEPSLATYREEFEQQLASFNGLVCLEPDLTETKCTCDIKNLMSTGHEVGCIERGGE